MPSATHVVVPCPAQRNLDALTLVLADLWVSQRRELAPANFNEPIEGLVVELADNQLCGAAWGQRQPGSTAILWPPRLTSAASPQAALELIRAATAALDEAGVRMIQSLQAERTAPLAPTLLAAGFHYLADLLYLHWEAVPQIARDEGLEFEPYVASQQARLCTLIERTYEGTCDCPALNGKRPMDEVLAGYHATGRFRPENWLFVRHRARDVGVLMLADHSPAKHWELIYMGLVAEARGRHFGSAIVRHAQHLIHRELVERLVLAVDAENLPAIKMYNETGFRAWDRRSVFVRYAN